MTDLSQLIDKLEKADAGSRELDAIINAFHYTMKHPNTEKHYCKAEGEVVVLYFQDAFGRMRHSTQTGFPHYTTSLDAAIALVERVLPEGTWSIDQHRSEKCYAGVRQDDWTPPVHGFGWSPAIALCTALLKALHAKEQAR